MIGIYAKTNSFLRFLVSGCVTVMIFAPVGTERSIELGNQVFDSSTVVPVVDYTDTTPKQMEIRGLSIIPLGSMVSWWWHSERIAKLSGDPTNDHSIPGFASKHFTLFLFGTQLRL